MTVLSPFVYWAQNESNVFIKVDLKDVKVIITNCIKRKLGIDWLLCSRIQTLPCEIVNYSSRQRVWELKV